MKIEINQLTINVKLSGSNQNEEIKKLNELILQRNRDIEDLRKQLTQIDFLN